MTDNNKNQTIVIISIIAAIVVVCICATLIIIFGTGRSNSDAVNETTATQQVEQTMMPVQVTAQPIVTAPPVSATPIPRVDLYNPGLTYKRMDEIHSSYLTNDDTYRQIKEFIENFNIKCERYMNNGDTAVLADIRPGTTAYNQQTDYKKNHPNLIQNYEFVDVINTRTNGTFFYAWVHESRYVIENGIEKYVEDHWVYKLTYDANGMYIMDYTKDPAYK